jgi:hypothetical protein
MLTLNLQKACCIFLTGILLASCSKEAGFAAQEEPLKPKGPKQVKSCEIFRVVGYEPFLSTPRVFTFEYNSKGDPIKITPTLVSTGSPKHEFRYDKKGRLTDYIGPYNNGAFEFWHEYGYDDNDRIVTDTVYIFGMYGEEPANDFPSLRRLVAYEYDDNNRIKKVTTVFPVAGGSFVQEYNYDNNGNRILDGVVYDDNPNPLRTHNIWMFLSRDYSVNNPWSTAVYNDDDLPTTLVVPHSRFFIVGSLFPQFIEYTCKGEQGSSN